MSLTTEQEKLFEENKGLAYTTVHRRFNNPNFHAVHGIERDALFQYALIGLYEACKSFDASKGMKFSNYAIGRILWSVNAESRKDSLHNIDNNSFDLLDKTSLDRELYDGFTLLDSLEYKEGGFSEFELRNSVKKLDEEVNQGLSQMVQLRLDGYTLKDVGKIMNMSHQAVRQRLLRYRSEMMKCLLA